MRVYLAGRYSRRLELCSYAEELRQAGHEITSRWLAGNHQIDDHGLSVEAAHGKREQFALEDLADLSAADLLIAFTEPPRSTSSRGGRHVELGIALGQEKAVWVVGPRENVFCCLPWVRWYPSWQALLAERPRLVGAAHD